MRPPRAILQVLFLAACVGPLSRAALAQDKERLPPELAQSRSHAEIVGWLDRESFGAARVGLSFGSSGSFERADGTCEPATLGERFVFSQGFRLANLDGCTLTLRNDDVRLIDYGDDALLTIGGGRHRFSDVGRTGTRYVAELYVPLHWLGERKGRAAYRHTRDAKRAALLGAWRTTFKTKRSRHVGLSVFPAGRRDEREFVAGESLTFTFDTPEAGEQFNAAFRRAIKLCGEK